MKESNLQKIIDIVHRLNEDAPVNSIGGGHIAGTVQAGDDPPVRKKKPTVLARGKLPGARTRFKKGADFISSLKKNKYM
tara:strand:- start:121 stop:357 length:237 start_codon:yes stop_codon:yes gene_type:complete